MTDEPIIFNQKKAILDMCLRNAVRFARGEIQYTMDLHNQLQFAYENCSKSTREVMKTIFDMIEVDDR